MATRRSVTRRGVVGLLVGATAVAVVALATLAIRGTGQRLKGGAGTDSDRVPHLRARLAEAPDPARPIRVLFYGQSITRQGWWTGVAAHLQRRHPQHRFEIANRAVPGHDASRLERLVAADVLPYQPDLVIFHVYGPGDALRRTLETIRRGTVADVLLANDHLETDEDRAEERDPRRLVESGLLRRALQRLGWVGENSDWHAWRNHELLPELADGLGLALADVRAGWIQALEESGRKASDLLADAIHLNDAGEALMERLMVQALDRHLDAPALVATDTPRRTERRVAVTRHCERPIETRGYRVDIRPERDLAVQVEVDGRAPTAWPALLHADRPSPLPGTEFPGLLRVHPPSHPSTATDSLAPEDPHRLDIGPRGADGHYEVVWRRLSEPSAVVRGRTDQPLHWPSLGLRIEPGDWNLQYAERTYQVASFEGAQLDFRLHAPQPVVQAGPAGDRVVVRYPVNGPHRLCLTLLPGTDAPPGAAPAAAAAAPAAPAAPAAAVTLYEYRAPLDPH